MRELKSNFFNPKINLRLEIQNFGAIYLVRKINRYFQNIASTEK